MELAEAEQEEVAAQAVVLQLAEPVAGPEALVLLAEAQELLVLAGPVLEAPVLMVAVHKVVLQLRVLVLGQVEVARRRLPGPVKMLLPERLARMVLALIILERMARVLRAAHRIPVPVSPIRGLAHQQVDPQPPLVAQAARLMDRVVLLAD